MKIKINGIDQNFDKTLNVYELLVYLKYIDKKIAIEINDKLVSRSEYKFIHIQNNDSIEIIEAVGGG